MGFFGETSDLAFLQDLVQQQEQPVFSAEEIPLFLQELLKVTNSLKLECYFGPRLQDAELQKLIEACPNLTSRDYPNKFLNDILPDLSEVMHDKTFHLPI